MKSTGVVRKLDKLGRLVLPIELRSTLNIDIKDGLEILIDQNMIVLRKHSLNCFICGQSKSLVVFKEKRLCRDCIDHIKLISR